MKTSVMSQEIIKYLDLIPNGFYIDATYGLGGHAGVIVKYLNNNGKLIVLDKDLMSFLLNDLFNLNDKRIYSFFSSFDKITYFNTNISFLDGIVIDLGLSLAQLKNVYQGFGNNNNFFDLRLSQSNFRALDWLNFAQKQEIIDVLYFLGLSRNAVFFAESIIFMRKKYTFTTLIDFYHIFNKVHKFKKNNLIFINKFLQAIRYFINNDLTLLNIFISRIFSLIKHQGVIVLISFNSLEDLILKKFIFNSFNLVSFSIRPSILEVDKSLASRSAFMRVFKKL